MGLSGNWVKGWMWEQKWTKDRINVRLIHKFFSHLELTVLYTKVSEDQFASCSLAIRGFWNLYHGDWFISEFSQGEWKEVVTREGKWPDGGSVVKDFGHNYVRTPSTVLKGDLGSEPLLSHLPPVNGVTALPHIMDTQGAAGVRAML